MSRDTVPTPAGADRAIAADPVPVTRIEVLDFVGALFTGAPVDRAVLLAAARADDARPALAELLDGALPQRPVTGTEDLWRHVDVPEDLAAAGYRAHRAG